MKVSRISGNIVLYGTDCLNILRAMPDNSVDSIVTDPPAGIGFMNRDWDRDKGGRDQWVAWLQSVAAECLRVIKPGGHALVWAIPRTSHWTATAFEGAGWQVRDRITHLFGSGFPKSTNVSKKIDSELWKAWLKENTDFRDYFLELKRQIKTAPTKAERDAARAFYNQELAEIQAEYGFARKVIGTKRGVGGENLNDIVRGADVRTTDEEGAKGIGAYGVGAKQVAVDVPITTAATPEAAMWEGWGTGLKPAAEDWWLFRKPFKGTVAANVLAHGTGAINVDGCRVGFSGDVDKASAFPGGKVTSHGKGGSLAGPGAAQDVERSEFSAERSDAGRWPAHVIHDGSDEVVGLFPQVQGQVGMKKNQGGFRFIAGDTESKQSFTQGQKDTGSAARFFYCAKASRQDRDEGLDGFTPKRVSDRQIDDGAGGDNPRNRTNNARKNPHPTVKPTSLMRYLVKLITPSQGLVLDPFMGSGSTGKACAIDGFGFIGIDSDLDNIPVAEARIRYGLSQAGAWEVPADEEEVEEFDDSDEDSEE
jgi:DNA modification methylase